MLQSEFKTWFNTRMKTTEAIRAFGSIKELAAELGLSVQAIYQWGDDVPALRAYQIRDLIAARADQPNQNKEAA
jgi:transcriptional repressor of cell division inhibition gene dicB